MVDPAEQANIEYLVWRNNVCFLYDTLIEDTLVWPSLTVAWLPGVESYSFGIIACRSKPLRSTIRSLLLGTNTSGKERDYLFMAKVMVPGTAESEEEAATEVGAAVRIERQVPHQGEVNRARVCPQRQSIVATRSVGGDIFVFDTDKQAEPLGSKNTKFSPMLTLAGHTQEGLGLAWHPSRPELLLSGGYDNFVYLWDIVAGTSPVRCCGVHDSDVEDVAWHPTNSNIFASVGDDKKLLIGDTRSKLDAVSLPNAHAESALCLAFNPLSETLLATGGGDHTVLVRDLRKLRTPVRSLRYHTQEVTNVRWACERLISGGADGRVAVWDLGEREGPVFVHGGHRGVINDLDWAGGLVASVDSGNAVQVWKMVLCHAGMHI